MTTDERPLSGISEDEAKELFWVSMPGTIMPFKFWVNSNGSVTLLDLYTDGFTLHPNGRIEVTCWDYVAATVNVVALVRYLDSIGIRFETT